MPVHTVFANGIGQVVLDEPPLNILSQGLMAQVRESFAELGDEPTLRVIVLRAAGKHFSAGAAVEEHLPSHVHEMIPDFVDTVRAVASFPLPVVAAVQGRCLGGAFELVLGADLIVAGEGALMGVPEIQLGVFPPLACVQLPALVGPALAAELIYTGDPIPARSLLEAGLLRVVVPDDHLLDTALDLAARIARHSAAALAASKRALGAAAADRDGDHDAALNRVTRIYLDELMSTEDAVEGLTSFIEKRRPVWSHR